MTFSPAFNSTKENSLRFSKSIKSMLFSFLLISVFGANLVAQTLPAASSCTSKDLELRSVKLAYTGLCFPYGQATNIVLEINNKTGSVRTAFACWAKLVRTKDGIAQAPVSVFICTGPIPPSATTSILTSETITVEQGESIVLKDIFLAWTTSNANQNCDFLKNNSATINPKCGVLPVIEVQAGVTGTLSQTNAVCGGNGVIKNAIITPKGGTAPYKVSIDGGIEYDVVANASYTFNGIDASVLHTITIKDKNGCTNAVKTTVSEVLPVVANAGADFTKNCLVNQSGASVGETAASGFSYAWSPSTGLSSSSISNPTANPTTTTEYTVTKRNISTGCTATDKVTVTVNNAPVTAVAGASFTKTCAVNINGKSIGESSLSGFTYAWSPATGLSDASIANPTANPTATTTYEVTKTNVSSGCFGKSTITVTVNNTNPTFGVTLVQPTVSLCAAATLGSVTFCATGGTGFEYSIDNGATYSPSSSFTNLVPGAVTGYKVRNSDGCVTTANCATVTACPSTAAAPVNAMVEGSVAVKSVEPSISESKPTVKAYPNPFNGQVNFNIQTPIAGKSVLEVFDVMGRKIGVAFQGNMDAGEIRNVQYNLPGNYSGTLIYRLSVGQQLTNGKIISAGKKNQNRP